MNEFKDGRLTLNIAKMMIKVRTGIITVGRKTAIIALPVDIS